jgi:parvulin-like peptidyl-prolyl isomerase
MQTVVTVKLTRTEPITVKQLKNEIALLEAQARRPLSVDEKNQLLDGLINQRLVLQAAERDKINVSEGELNQQIDRVRAALAQNIGRTPTESELAQAVRTQYNLDIPMFREQLRRQLVMEKYILAKKEPLIKSAKAPAQTEIQDFYDLNRSSLVRPDTVRVTMIQVPFKDDRTAARRTADNLAREIGTSAAKFDEVALRSGDAAGFQSGDAGYLPKNPEGERVIGASALKTAFSLKQGQVSGVLESPRGFLIIKITETYEQKQLTLDDVLDLASKTTVRQYIAGGLSQNKQLAVLEQAQKEIYDELRKGSPFTVDRRYLPW